VAAPGSSKNVTVVGLLSSLTGLGEGARLSLAALAQAHVPTRHIDLSGAFGCRDLASWPGSGASPSFAPGDEGAAIVHINAPLIPLAYLRLPRRLVRRSRLVGYWAWELPIVPKNWRKAFAFVHEVWVPSRFVADALAKETDLPIRVVAHPVAANISVGEAIERRQLDLPEDALLVLSAFNAASGFERKNPLAAIEAFRRAFGASPRHRLLIKAINPHHQPGAMARLRRAVADMPNVTMVESACGPGEMRSLIAAADIVLSLHRSEGFGLVAAEAMLLGKPVVATGWSGNMDFMNAENSRPVNFDLIPARDPDGIYDVPGACWADPDISHAAVCLQELASSRALRDALGLRAKGEARLSFGSDRFVHAARAAFAF
jgi:glycosyltransferase involved in cell wall biosynthesis